MPVRVAINGFGRIGRTILRQILTTRASEEIEVVCLNDIAPLATCAYLFAYDSVFGPFSGQVGTDRGMLEIDGASIPFHHAPDLSKLDLSDVDIVLECTGQATRRPLARRGLTAGAGSVIISGPSSAAVDTIVRGANDEDLSSQRVVSCESCTTNALAPLLRLLDDLFGVEAAHMTTVHCYTGSQPTVDAPREDLARSRAGALSMVPTTTSAGRLTETVLPGLAGKLTTSAIRVPVASVSSIDLSIEVQDRREFQPRLREAVGASPVIGWTDLPLVSSDLRGRSESLVLAGRELMEGSRLVRLLGWYDNEWGFSNRMIDLALRMAARREEDVTHVA